MKPITPLVLGTLVALLPAVPAAAQVLSYENVSPTSSSLDPSDPDGASGGRTNGLATTPGNNQILYAATEWGGLYKTTDKGLTWAHLVGHRPTATWDVEVDPSSASRVYATSFYDGRSATQAGINVSTDGGTTWSRPASVTPPAGFCNTAADRTEPSGFGISIDAAAPATAYAGTACGLAKTTDSGATWAYIDPTPATLATRVWDVVVHHGGIVDVCGDDGHLRSTDGGTTWRQGSGISAGRCSIAASPDESYVLLAVVGTTIYETTNADAVTPTWTATRSNPSPQGRIPFVATNQRSDSGGNVFDLWFGDVSLYRATCTTPAVPGSGGAPRCGTGNTPAWVPPNGYTRNAGGHDDMGDIAFDSQTAVDACPVLMSSDGGVYRNTISASPGCHAPAWEQPNVTPRALWPFALSGADQAGTTGEDLYFGNQDNGSFGATNMGAATPTWTNSDCCDGFDQAAEPDGVVYSICCYGGGRSTRYFRRGRGFAGGAELNTYPASGLPPGFIFPDVVVRWANHSYAMITRDCTPGSGGCPSADGGLFVTTDITANPIVWTELGNASEPASNNLCGVYAGVSAGTPTFYVQKGGCNSAGTTDQVWKFTGTSPAGTWTQLAALPNGGGFGVLAVDPSDPTRLFASGLTAATANTYRSTDGGTTWQPLAQLDSLMGNATFPMRVNRGPTNFTGFGVYWQPSLLAVDPVNSNIVVAGGQDSGIFLSTDGGSTFTLVTDPVDGTGATPHLARPRFAYFDVEAAGSRWLYVGSQGRGIWRLTLDSSVPVLLQRLEVE